jgi:hypothetical protein
VLASHTCQRGGTLTPGSAAGPGAQVEAELKRADMQHLLLELLEANATSGKQVVELVATAGQTTLPASDPQAITDGVEGVVPAHVAKLTPKQQEVDSTRCQCAAYRATLLPFTSRATITARPAPRAEVCPH